MLVLAPPRLGVTANLPIALDPTFEGDELAYLFGTSLRDAVLVLALPSRRTIACNTRLLGFLDLGEPPQAGRPSLTLESLLSAGDLQRFAAAEARALQGQEARVTLSWRWQGAERGGGGVAQTTVTSLIHRGQRFLLAFLSPPGMDDGVDAARQMAEQKARARAAIHGSLRLYELNVKIRRSTSLTQNLLATSSEEELFAEAARLLTDGEGLDYRGVTFALLEEGKLRVAYSTCEARGTVYPLDGDSPMARFVAGTHAGVGEGSEVLFALANSKSLVGVGRALLHSRERSLLNESCVTSSLQLQVLQDIGGIIAMVAQNLRLQQEILRQSRMDPLTQAFNRHHFVEQLGIEVERARRYGRSLSAVFIDLDDFKLINDRYGHLQGDDVLGRIGRLLREQVREVDVVCRYGGDEFVILLPETDQGMATKTANKLLEQLRLLRFHGPRLPEGGLQISASLGVSTLRSGQSETDLLLAADTAVYRAKQLGRNRVEAF